jgi:hypothetical protein
MSSAVAASGSALEARWESLPKGVSSCSGLVSPLFSPSLTSPWLKLDKDELIWRQVDAEAKLQSSISNLVQAQIEDETQKISCILSRMIPFWVIFL